MKLQDGFYAAYRTNGQGKYLRILSRGFNEEWRCQEWAKFEKMEHPSQDIIVIEVKQLIKE